MAGIDRFVFFERSYPSANMVLVKGERPVLVDPGYGADLPETERLLREAGVPSERLALILNTHYHCDHVGGNSGLQRRYGIPIATHRWEAALVNHRDREACGVEWLDQPVESYHVDQTLSNGDEIDAGGVVLRVLDTPGHTLGHVSFYSPEEETLILGDAAHSDDVAWLNPFREGVGAIVRALETLDRLSALRIRRAYSGHGPPIEDLDAAIAAARQRYERWLEEPERMAWHGCKRIFAYALMIYGGFGEAELRPYLFRCPWFHDYARHGFGVEPDEFVEPLLSEILRSKAAAWQNGRLVALGSYNPPPPGWPPGPTRPKDWPKVARKDE